VTDTWLDGLAERLGVDALGDEERSRILAVARDVAHGVERRITPLATYLLGAAVAERTARGAAADEALHDAVELLESLVPDAEPDAIP
jgi:Domain of unknown function (DUF6457)